MNKKKVIRKTDSRGNQHLYDLSTSNRSFINLASDLSKLGTKNCYFMLEIYDVSLVGVDPYACDKDGNTTLSKDTIDRIISEIVRNPWYFLREICRIPAAGSPFGIKYEANRGNIAQAWCILHDLDSWLNLTRQKGKTQSAIAIQNWFYNFGTNNASFIFINKDSGNAKDNLNRMKQQMELLPKYLQFKSFIDEEGSMVKGTDNATAIKHPITKNSVVVRASAASIEKATSLARGLSAQFLHFDEVEFTANIKTIVENSVSTFEQSAMNARKFGSHAARIFTSTPGDLDTQPGLEAQYLLDNTVRWYDWSWTNEETGAVHPSMYDMTRDQILDYMHAQGKDKMDILYIEYSYKQIGLSEEWLDEQARKIGNRLTFMREVLLQRLHGSSLSPYNQEDIEYIQSVQREPVDELWLLDYYKFDIYKPLKRNIPYLVGIDCATGGGDTSDNNAITIINPNTLEPDAEFECSFIGETKFQKLIETLVMDYIPRACVIIERNSVGDSIIDHLIEESSIEHNLYKDKNKDLLDGKIESASTVESMLKKRASEKRNYGVYTSTSSRQRMFSILANHVADYKDKFITKNITRDLSRLVRLASGKIAAVAPFHDDSIMSYLIALYVYYHGTNLYAYGIHPGMGESNEESKHEEVTLANVDQEKINPKVLSELERSEELTKKAEQQRIDEIKAYREAASNSAALYKSGLVNRTTYAPMDNDVEYYDEDDEDIPMDFFNEMNNL